MMDEQKNLAAWECLDQALFTSSHVKAKDMEKGSTDWDNVYPVSKEETDKMKNLVDEAVRKADDPSDSFFRERVSDLREIISYSYSKHRTWKWSLIFGSIIAACIFWYFGNQDKEDAQKYAKDVTLVENWKKADTTITYDKLDASSELSYQLYERRVQSANAYKLMKLHDLKRNAESYREGMKTAKHSADTAKLDKNIESYKKRMAECEEKMEKYQDEFDEVADMDFDEIQKMALKDTQGLVDDINDSASTKTGWMIYLIILIPLYIISGYPRGYVISAHRRQHGFMRTLQKIGFAVASFFFGSGLLTAHFGQNNIKLGFLFGSGSGRAGSSNSHGSSSGNAELFFDGFDQFRQLQNAQSLDLVDHTSDFLRHDSPSNCLVFSNSCGIIPRPLLQQREPPRRGLLQQQEPLQQGLPPHHRLFRR